VYGSSRLGVYRGYRQPGERRLGHKTYELSNHLGNVLAVITDNIRVKPDSAWATVVNSTDYYAFGSEMPTRTYSMYNDYRYGFNGKEQDTESTWGDDIYDYGFRIYNPKIGKFLSVDPLSKEYPWYTPYQFAANKPIIAIDKDGAEALFSISLDLLKKKITIENHKTIVILEHTWGDGRSISTRLLREGLTETEAKAVKDGSYLRKAWGGFLNPQAIQYKSELEELFAITKEKSKNLEKAITGTIAEKMVTNLINDTEREVNSVNYKYQNAFLHFTGQTLSSAIYGERISKFAADIHEREYAGVFSGEGEEGDLVDAYIDLVNNEWGRQFGTVLAKRFDINSETVWTEQLTTDFLNSIQDYFTASYSALTFKKFGTTEESKELVRKITEDLNQKTRNVDNKDKKSNGKTP
jgi:RHS repeat-associated protein